MCVDMTVYGGCTCFWEGLSFWPMTATLETTKTGIDCDTTACLHCIVEGNHASHRVLNIYKLVYKDVVSMDQMSSHIDCSRVQVCNRIIV
ncbi:hypothetical protein Hanom_Chr17g01580891 [Helianthus anomalus]